MACKHILAPPRLDPDRDSVTLLTSQSLSFHVDPTPIAAAG